MKTASWLMTMVATGALTLAAPAPGANQLKLDLVGQSMGGREKSWKFQSSEQIKKLEIKDRKEEAQKRVYIVALQLQASKTGGTYAAEARVEYEKTTAAWRIKQVGLISLEKIE